jgi:hypothetical protein
LRGAPETTIEITIHKTKNPAAIHRPFGKRPITLCRALAMRAKAEKANAETIIIFMRLIGSKFEKGDIARVVAGPRKRIMVPKRRITASFLISLG